MGERDPEEDRGQSPGSRLLSGLDRWTSRTLVALGVLSAALISLSCRWMAPAALSPQGFAVSRGPAARLAAGR